MPPRKSDVSKSITDEGAAGATTPVQEGPSKEKESKEGKDGINIEVAAWPALLALYIQG
jgi:hypothetical protein